MQFDPGINSKKSNQIENMENINFLVRGLFCFNILNIFSGGTYPNYFNFSLPLFPHTNVNVSLHSKAIHKNNLYLIVDIIKNKLTTISSTYNSLPLIYENLRVLFGIEYTGCTSLGFEPFLQYLFILYEHYPDNHCSVGDDNNYCSNSSSSSLKPSITDYHYGNVNNIHNIDYSGCVAIYFPSEINYHQSIDINHNKAYYSSDTTTTTTTKMKYPISWPDHLPIKIYYCLNHLPVFLENIRGLSDTLTYLKIPNKIVTKVTPHTDNIYIVCSSVIL